MSAESQVVATCMGRLAHLQQTLPSMVNQPGCRVIVVDYSCPENSGAWVEENFSLPHVSVVRVTGHTRFDRSDAKNAGIIAASTPWVCLIDADVLLEPSFADEIRRRLATGSFLRGSAISEGTGGTFIATRDALMEAGMHDLVYRGWGDEDDDLLESLVFHGQQCRTFPNALIEHLHHDDSLRTQFHEHTNRRISHMINRIYRSAKWDLARLAGSVPPVSVRQSLYSNISEQLTRTLRDQSITRVAIDIGEMSWTPLSAKCSRTLMYTVKMDSSVDEGEYIR